MADEPKPVTTNRLYAAIAGGTVGAAVAQIVAWVLKSYTNVDMPVEIQMAMASLITALSAIVPAQLTPVQPPKDDSA